MGASLRWYLPTYLPTYLHTYILQSRLDETGGHSCSELTCPTHDRHITYLPTYLPTYLDFFSPTSLFSFFAGTPLFHIDVCSYVGWLPPSSLPRLLVDRLLRVPTHRVLSALAPAVPTSTNTPRLLHTCRRK